jgi:hypothetical protein
MAGNRQHHMEIVAVREKFFRLARYELVRIMSKATVFEQLQHATQALRYVGPDWHLLLKTAGRRFEQVIAMSGEPVSVRHGFCLMYQK